MTDQLRISILQRQLHWENIDANLAMFADHIQLLPPQSTDLIVLPEMFTTGFSMNPSALAEPMTGKTVKWMEQMAKGSEAVVCGSAIIEENGHYFNRLIWMPPDGEFEVYDKRHCFTLAGEDQYYQSGDSRLIVTWKGWKICPLICYDLRFPVWSRNTDDYDLLLYVANWPDKRSNAWKSLLEARAIENLAYTIGVNRVGDDEKGNHYTGDSRVVDYSGKVLYQVTEVEDTFTVALSKNQQEAFRNNFLFLADRDHFEIK